MNTSNKNYLFETRVVGNLVYQLMEKYNKSVEEILQNLIPTKLYEILIDGKSPVMYYSTEALVEAYEIEKNEGLEALREYLVDLIPIPND